MRLRAQVDTLSSFAHTGAPTAPALGTLRRRPALPAVRTRVLRRLRQADVRATRARRSRARSAALPDAPRRPTTTARRTRCSRRTSSRRRTRKRARRISCRPLLMTRWLNGAADRQRARAARPPAVRHVRHGAARTRIRSPTRADAAAVSRRRARFLRKFAGSERIYQFMLAEAAKTNPSIQFNRKVAGLGARTSPTATRCRARSPRAARRSCTTAFKTVDKYLKGESWVVGDDAGQVDQAKLVGRAARRDTRPTTSRSGASSSSRVGRRATAA